MTERIEAERFIPAPAADVFAVLCDPHGHVAIDASGMLQDADGDIVEAAGDTFVIHMDRESLNDIPDYGKYDVTVTIEEFQRDRLISWSILGKVRPGMGHTYGYRLEPADGGSLGHLVLRLVERQPGLEGLRHLPGRLGDQPERHARHPRPDRAPRLSAWMM